MANFITVPLLYPHDTTMIGSKVARIDSYIRSFVALRNDRSGELVLSTMGKRLVPQDCEAMFTVGFLYPNIRHLSVLYRAGKMMERIEMRIDIDEREMTSTDTDTTTTIDNNDVEQLASSSSSERHYLEDKELRNRFVESFEKLKKINFDYTDETAEHYYCTSWLRTIEKPRHGCQWAVNINIEVPRSLLLDLVQLSGEDDSMKGQRKLSLGFDDEEGKGGDMYATLIGPVRGIDLHVFTTLERLYGKHRSRISWTDNRLEILLYEHRFARRGGEKRGPLTSTAIERIGELYKVFDYLNVYFNGIDYPKPRGKCFVLESRVVTSEENEQFRLTESEYKEGKMYVPRVSPPSSVRTVVADNY